LSSHSSTDPAPKTSLAEFLRLLATTGDVAVPAFDQNGVVLDDICRALIAEKDVDSRVQYGGDLPPLSEPAAHWAAVQLFRACQFLVCRDVPENLLKQILGQPCPVGQRAETAYSVDLLFQFLPDLYTIASRLGPNDPLVGELVRLARDWPLSSVGIPLGDAPVEITFASDPALMRIYADRVTERGAKDRLNNAALRQILRSDAGLLPDILPFSASTYSHD
jgi:hypothetical protein